MQKKKPSSSSSSPSSSSVGADDEVLKSILDRKISDLFEDDDVESFVLAVKEMESQLKAVAPEKEESKRRVQNKGKGWDMDTCSWTQSLQEVIVKVPVSEDTVSAAVAFEIKENHLKVGLKDNDPPILDEDLFQTVEVDECFWSMERGSSSRFICIILTKQNQMEWWKYLVKGEPEIDTQKVEPAETSCELPDMDPETRKYLTMFDPLQKNMGLPPKEEAQKQEMLEKFMAAHPEICF
ncbi:hypothetical protein MKW94_010929 [Papaver nudicaule]|uniref:CS domain-containing protein n=1 Tax=Papaver nudicaule TaxID=74823 RepID=A0AA42B4E4_PAPNU|nr:hypothetical protein [Papaver nudicaule]